MSERYTTKEKLRKVITLSLATSLGFAGITACAVQGSAPAPAPVAETATEALTPTQDSLAGELASGEFHEIDIDVVYTEGGQRITRYGSPYSTDGVDSFGSLGTYLTYCDGNYMVDVPLLAARAYANTGPSLTRTLDVEACRDGKLTPTDFDQF